MARQVLGRRRGPKSRIRAQAPVERAQEGLAVVGVVLPGVLAVEDDRDQPRALGGLGGDRLELAEQIFGPGLAGHLAVAEADVVGELAVAEQDRRAVGDLVRLVEQVGPGHRLALTQWRLERSREHLLVGRDPADAGLLEERRDGLGDGALARPHAPRRTAEEALVVLDGGVHVELGVFRVAEALGGHGRARHGLFGEVAVVDQGQDRVEVGRGRHLEVALFLELLVQRHDARERRAVRGEHVGLVRFGVAAALAGDRG
ncbi:hypothetical protein D3C72_1089520 [compost metagenome]